MSTRYNNGSHYENHQRAAELHDLAAHAHRAAQLEGEGEHATADEQSRQALEHSRLARERSHAAYEVIRGVTVGHGIAAFGHAETAALAHSLWLDRGSPEGSQDQDWFEATRILRSRANGH